MSELKDIRTQLEAQRVQIANFKASVGIRLTNIAGDITNLKAQIEALAAQLPDSEEMQALRETAASIGAEIDGLQAVTVQAEAIDESVPAIPPPGTPA